MCSLERSLHLWLLSLVSSTRSFSIKWKSFWKLKKRCHPKYIMYLRISRFPYPSFSPFLQCWGWSKDVHMWPVSSHWYTLAWCSVTWVTTVLMTQECAWVASVWPLIYISVMLCDLSHHHLDDSGVMCISSVWHRTAKNRLTLKVQGTVISMKWTSDTDITKRVEWRCVHSKMNALKLYWQYSR